MNREIEAIKLEESTGGLYLFAKERGGSTYVLMGFTSWGALKHFTTLLTDMYNSRAETTLPTCVAEFMLELQRKGELYNG